MSTGTHAISARPYCSADLSVVWSLSSRTTAAGTRPHFFTLWSTIRSIPSLFGESNIVGTNLVPLGVKHTHERRQSLIHISRPFYTSAGHFTHQPAILHISRPFWTSAGHFTHQPAILNISRPFWTSAGHFEHQPAILNISRPFWTSGERVAIKINLPSPFASQQVFHLFGSKSTHIRVSIIFSFISPLKILVHTTYFRGSETK